MRGPAVFTRPTWRSQALGPVTNTTRPKRHIRTAHVDGVTDLRMPGVSGPVLRRGVRGARSDTMKLLGMQLKSAFGLPDRRPVAVPHESLDRRFKVRHSSAPC
jgi:hypothetical protein